MNWLKIVIVGILGAGWSPSFCSGFGYADTKLYDGDNCKHLDSDGICTPQPDCHQAVQEVKLHGYHSFARCGFNESVEIVCCPSLSPDINTRKSIRVCKDYRKELPQLTENFPATDFVVIDLQDNSSDNMQTIVAHGVAVRTDEYPHVVALGFYRNDTQVYTFDCGGTLISNKYVITAAHCIANVERNKLEVIRIGSVEVPSEAVSEIEIVPDIDHKIKRVILHPQYNRGRSIHDIALVELEKEVEFQGNIRPACLNTEDEEPSEMQVAGWGAVNITGARSKILQKANVSSIPIEQCKARLGSGRRSVGSTQICAQDVKSDTCEGDSGGPLQIEDNRLFTLVGITSFGSPCFGGLPGVYTKVFSHLDWIEETVWA